MACAEQVRRGCRQVSRASRPVSDGCLRERVGSLGRDEAAAGGAGTGVAWGITAADMRLDDAMPRAPTGLGGRQRASN